MRRRHKDGLCADSIHVDAHARLQVVQVDVAVLCDQINDAVLAANLGEGGWRPCPTCFPRLSGSKTCGLVEAYLHSDGKVRLSLGREKHIHCFLSKWLVSCRRLTDFNDVQLQEGEQTTMPYFSIDGLIVSEDVEVEVVTFPPACERTAKQKRVEALAFPSILNSPKAAAWPSMGWETFLSTEYSCIAPTTRFCYRTEEKNQTDDMV